MSGSRHDNIHAQTADVTDAASLQRLYCDAQAARGSFAIVVANAGAAESAPAEKVSRALWDETIAVNLTGAFLSVQPALAAMRERNWGRIVFIASTAGLKGYAYVAPYVAAKHGIAGLTKTVALEAAKDGVTVNCISPGYVWTSLVENQIPDTMKARGLTRDQVINDVLLAAQPTKRFVTPEQVAAMALFLCGEEAASITGANLSMDGGWTSQ